MLKTSASLNEVTSRIGLTSKRVCILQKRVFIHEMLGGGKDVHLPCLTATFSPVRDEKSKDYDMYIRPIRNQHDIFVWTRAGYAKRAWKSV